MTPTLDRPDSPVATAPPARDPLAAYASRLRCPLCAHDESAALPRAPEHLFYRRCVACGFAWLRNSSDAAEDIAQESQNSYYLQQQGRTEADLAAIKPWVEAILARTEWPVRRVAELGCTNGLVLKSFANKGLEVLGVERCPVTASFGIEMLQLPIVIADLNGYQPRTRYDLVWMTHILEHMLDPIGTLRRVAREWCAPQSLIYIQVPALDLFLEDETTPPTGELFCGPHASLFVERSLAHAIRAAGFERYEIQRHDIKEPQRRITMLDAYLFHRA